MNVKKITDIVFWSVVEVPQYTIRTLCASAVLLQANSHYKQKRRLIVVVLPVIRGKPNRRGRCGKPGHQRDRA